MMKRHAMTAFVSAVTIGILARIPATRALVFGTKA